MIGGTNVLLDNETGLAALMRRRRELMGSAF
jgi:hypothetical protein